jgi:hypothetical protein
MMGKRMMNWKIFKGSGHSLINPGTCLEGLTKTTEDLIQDS